MSISALNKFFEAPEEESADPAEAESLRFSSSAELAREYARRRNELGERAADDPDCELLRLRVELANAEYDPAGALKFKSFVRKSRELFQPAPESENGKGYRVAEPIENRRYLIVSMGELGRLNKEGHKQAAGDAGLEAVVRAVREALGDRREGVSIYRYDSSEYMIEFTDISEINFVFFEEALRGKKLDLGDFRHLEAPPLTFTRIDFAEVLDIMESINLTKPERGEIDAHEAAVESVTILTRFANYNLEREKFVTRVKRAIEKLEAVKKGEIKREKAEAFFATYLKKGLYGSGLESLEDIDDLWRDGRDLADFERSVELMAAAAAKSRFADDRWFQLYERHLASSLERAYLKTVQTGENSSRAADFFSDDADLARIPNPHYGTQGLAILSRKKEQIGRRTGKWAEVDRIAYEAEAMKRDVGTGLLERGQLFEELEARITLGQPTSLIFIDLGYLKYFNDAGRRAVGDAALLKTAEVLEEAIIESEVEARAYRYSGGDEFVILVEGDAAEAAALKEDIERIRASAGRIPDLRSLREQGYAPESVGDSRPDYAPMELVLNYGISELRAIDMLLSDLGEQRVGEMLDKSRRPLEAVKADLLVKTADAAVGYQKATSRFCELLELMARPGYADENSPEHKRVESVIAASLKAIFHEQGGEEALRYWAAARPENQEELIDRFVADRLEKIDEILSGEKELVDKLVEIHAARNRLITELEKLQEENSEDKNKIEALQARLFAAEKARQEIIEARQNIVGTAVDKKNRM